MSENTSNEPGSPLASKRSRENHGTAEKIHPTKKSKLDSAGTVKTKRQSTFLLLLTKGGEQYQHLNEEEHSNLTKAIITTIFEGNLAPNEIPHFDWSSKPRGRSLIACDDEIAVTWLKKFVANYADGFGAWRSGEGPNRRPLQVMVPYPTGDRAADEIISMVIKANYLEGEFIVLYSKKIPKIGHFIRFSADQQFAEGLERIDFRPFCGLTRLNIFDEKQRQCNKEVATSMSSAAAAAAGTTTKRIDDPAETRFGEGDPPPALIDHNGLPPAASMNASEEHERVIAAVQTIGLGGRDWIDEVEEEEEEAQIVEHRIVKQRSASAPVMRTKPWYARRTSAENT